MRGTRGESRSDVPGPIHCPEPQSVRLGPNGAFGLGRLARGTEPEPMVPTMPPFFLPGRVIVPSWKKREQA